MWCEIDSRIWIRVGLIVLKEIGGARREEKKREALEQERRERRIERREEKRSEAPEVHFQKNI